MGETALQVPFFVVGTGRCGTTLFRNLLRSHPEIYMPRETHWLPILWNELGNRQTPFDHLMMLVDRVYMAKGRTPFQRIMQEHRLDEDTFRADLKAWAAPHGQTTVVNFQAAFYSLLAQYQGGTIIGDKTPDYGFCLELLHQLWPTARFIHIFRDGRDVALSMSRVLSFRILAALHLTHWWAVALDRQYERGLAQAQADLPLAAFFQLWDRRFTRIRDEITRIPADSILEIQYETLLTQPKTTLEAVHGFLHLPGDRGWIETAVQSIRADNLHRNHDLPERQILTQTFADRLTSLGFER